MIEVNISSLLQIIQNNTTKSCKKMHNKINWQRLGFFSHIQTYLTL